MNVTPPQVDMFARMLNATVLNHQVISQNIANVNTPGYHGKVMEFQEDLLNAVRGETDPQAPLELERFVANSDGKERVDGNNVDLDLEVSRLNRNGVFHQSLLQLMASQLNMTRSAITGR